MLIITRREKDRIVFPALGISIDVMKVGRSRVALGIDAPRGIRVMRHELLESQPRQADGEDLVEIVRDQVMSLVQDDIDAAASRLNAAHEDLVAGKTEEALVALSRALSQLDALRSKQAALSEQASHQRHVETSSESDAVPSETIHHPSVQTPSPAWNQAEPSVDEVAERRSQYTLDASDSVAEPTLRNGVTPRRVLVMKSAGECEDWIASDVAFDAAQVDYAYDAWGAFYQLSRAEKPECLVIPDGQIDDNEMSTMMVLRKCSRHPNVPIVDSLERLDRYVTTSL